MERIQQEPALTLAMVQAAVALAVGFGLDITGEQVALIVAFSAAVLGWVTRTQVSPYEPDPDGFELPADE